MSVKKNVINTSNPELITSSVQCRVFISPCNCILYCVIYEYNYYVLHCRSTMPWHSSLPTAPVSIASAIGDVDKHTVALALEKREPIVMKHTAKSGKQKGSKKGTEDDNERNLVQKYITCTCMSTYMYLHLM